MDSNKYLVNAGFKASDVILSGPELVSLAQTFRIPLGFGDITIGKLCEHHAVPEHLFLALCNMMLFQDYIPDTSRLGVDDLPFILHFLESTHKYYRSVVLPQLHADVHKIAALCPPEVKVTVNLFFDEYEHEMNRHIEREEAHEFGYIHALLEGYCPDSISIESFKEQHDDAEIKLEDFKNIITKYVPQECNIPERYSAIIRMLHIEKQLYFHTRIEEMLLYPLVTKIEKQIKGNERG